MAADEIVARYKLEVQGAVNSLNTVANTAEKTAKKTDDVFGKMSDNITGQFKALGSTIAAAFAVEKIISFGKEAVMLAAKAEGVERAFARLGSPQLLAGLREATKGTVSDLVLMQNAVRASNFKIPLDQLAKLFEFARRRAAETGESVDYLVDSIVLGIGRKSPLILDNLGISAVELRKRFNGISVEAAEIGDIAKIVGDIASEEMRKMGDEAVNAATDFATLGAAWDNWTKKIGSAINDILRFYGVLSDPRMADALNEKKADGFAQATARVNMELKGTANETERLAKLEELNDKARAKAAERLAQLQQLDKDRKRLQEQILIEEQKAESFRNGVVKNKGAAQRAEALKKELELLEQTTQTARVGLMSAQDYVKATQSQIDAINKKNNESTTEIRNVYFLQEAIKKLKEEQADMNTTRERDLQIVDELKPLEEELAFLMGKQKDAADKTSKSLKELKEQLGQMVQVVANGIPGVRQFSVDVNGINNSLNTLNDSLSQARAQLNAAPIGSDAFKQAQKDIADLELRIKEALGEVTLAVPEMYQNVSSGIAEAAAEARRATEQQISDMNRLYSEFFSGAMQMSSIATQMRLDDIQREEQRLNDQFKKGLISREEYDKKVANLRRKEAQAQKDQALFNAITGMASAIINALQTQPFLPVGLASAALAGTLGAAQIVAIERAPLPQFAEGGWVTPEGWITGRKHKQGGVKLEAEGGEFITNVRAAKRWGGLLEYINTNPNNLNGWDGLADSIKLNSSTTNQFNDRNLLSAIDRHRESDKNGFMYVARELSKAMKSDHRSRWA